MRGVGRVGRHGDTALPLDDGTGPIVWLKEVKRPANVDRKRLLPVPFLRKLVRGAHAQNAGGVDQYVQTFLYGEQAPQTSLTCAASDTSSVRQQWIPLREGQIESGHLRARRRQRPALPHNQSSYLPLSPRRFCW